MATAKQITKNIDKERVKWNNDMMKKLNDWQKENKCVIVPASMPHQSRPDLLQLGYQIFKEEEIVQLNQEESKIKTA